MQQRRKGEWAAELGGGDVLSSGDGMHGTSRYGAGKLRKRETEVGGKSRTGDGSGVGERLRVVDSLMLLPLRFSLWSCVELPKGVLLIIVLPLG